MCVPNQSHTADKGSDDKILGITALRSTRCSPWIKYATVSIQNATNPDNSRPFPAIPDPSTKPLSLRRCLVAFPGVAFAGLLSLTNLDGAPEQRQALIAFQWQCFTALPQVSWMYWGARYSYAGYEALLNGTVRCAAALLRWLSPACPSWLTVLWWLGRWLCANGGVAVGPRESFAFRCHPEGRLR